MPDLVGVSIVGDQKVALRFDEFPTQLADRLLSRITVMTQRLEMASRAVAPRKTGRLQSDIDSSVYDDRPRAISGVVYVGDDYSKAGALEWGAPGKRNRNFVKDHRARLTHVFRNRLSSPLNVMIRAHRRRLNLQAWRYLRGPLGSQSSTITEQLSEAVAEAIGDQS